MLPIRCAIKLIVGLLYNLLLIGWVYIRSPRFPMLVAVVRVLCTPLVAVTLEGISCAHERRAPSAQRDILFRVGYGRAS